ncbi:hypothetical protein PSAC2689_70222 [Paraburkholderia sacchari]|uniref:hypothetical protein n=1 Tax=Paraburkholderia sacchari TaxID=159450 RepID=UPI0039A51AE8
MKFQNIGQLLSAQHHIPSALNVKHAVQNGHGPVPHDDIGKMFAKAGVHVKTAINRNDKPSQGEGGPDKMPVIKIPGIIG